MWLQIPGQDCPRTSGGTFSSDLLIFSLKVRGLSRLLFLSPETWLVSSLRGLVSTVPPYCIWQEPLFLVPHTDQRKAEPRKRLCLTADVEQTPVRTESVVTHSLSVNCFPSMFGRQQQRSGQHSSDASVTFSRPAVTRSRPSTVKVQQEPDPQWPTSHIHLNRCSQSGSVEPVLHLQSSTNTDLMWLVCTVWSVSVLSSDRGVFGPVIHYLTGCLNSLEVIRFCCIDKRASCRGRVMQDLMNRKFVTVRKHVSPNPQRTPAACCAQYEIGGLLFQSKFKTLKCHNRLDIKASAPQIPM